MENLDKKYVVVTAVSSYRVRYAIPMDELQALNIDHPVETTWALDSVTCEEVKEFSQEWLGEHIVDHSVLTEEEILELFDKDNAYLKDWTEDQKISLIRDWKVNSRLSID